MPYTGRPVTYFSPAGSDGDGRGAAAAADSDAECGYSLPMNRSDLIGRLAARAETLTLKNVELTASVMLEALAHAMARGDRIEIRGFRGFTLSYWRPRQGRNPQTGAPVPVPAEYLPHFKAGKELRDRVNEVAERSAPPQAE